MENSRFKFRAWHYEHKEMVYFDNKKASNDIYIASNILKLMADNSPFLMQYTGLKDIDGVEIYEGDIVQIVQYESRYDGTFDEFRSKVIFINGYFGYLQYEEHLGEKTDYYLSSVCTEDGIDHKGSHFCNVIGNVYENPELLEMKWISK